MFILEGVDEFRQDSKKAREDKLRRIFGNQIEGKIDELKILKYGIDKLNLGMCVKFDVSTLHIHPAIIDQICEDEGITAHRINKNGRQTIDYIHK